MPSTAASVFTAIGAAGNILLFLSQTLLIRQLVKEGSSERYSFLPSLTLMGCLTLWCAYTVWVLPEPQLYAANFPGMIIPFLNLLTFAVYASPARRLRILGATALTLGAAWGVPAGLFVGRVERADTILGIIICVASISFFVSPVEALLAAWREQDTSRVPILMSMVQFFQAGVWVVAAVLLSDVFILGVNAAGAASALAQIACYTLITLRSKRAAALAGEPKEAASGSV